MECTLAIWLKAIDFIESNISIFLYSNFYRIIELNRTICAPLHIFILLHSAFTG